jgi:hypothetical protein
MRIPRAEILHDGRESRSGYEIQVGFPVYHERMAKPPCRLHVLLARDRPTALILRRGPSAWYHLIKWNTQDDTFESGAWFKGRIYERRCDLSPDGELLVYFVLKGNWKTSYKGTWTAVSRVPWLHALVLWPQGDTWGGGGRFVGNRRLAVSPSSATHPDHPLVGLELAEPGEGIAAPDVASDARFKSNAWSGRDQAGHAIAVRDGKLFRTRDGNEIEIADFNGLTPDPQPPPEWATRALPPLPSETPQRRPRKR